MSPTRHRPSAIEERGVEIEPVEVEPVDLEPILEQLRALIDVHHRPIYEAGALLLDHFYGGDPERAASQAPTKVASLRALVALCDTALLPVSRTWLRGAVVLAAMERWMPPEAVAYRTLTPTHQLLLAPLREDRQLVEQLAQSAVEQQWSSRELKQQIAALLDDDPPEPTSPSLPRALQRSLRLLAGPNGGRLFRPADLRALTPVQASRALEQARLLTRRLQELVAALERTSR